LQRANLFLIRHVSNANVLYGAKAVDNNDNSHYVRPLMSDRSFAVPIAGPQPYGMRRHRGSTATVNDALEGN